MNRNFVVCAGGRRFVAEDKVAIAADRAALDAAVLVAPEDGVVGSIGGVIGEIAGPEGVRLFGAPQPLPQKDDSGIQLFPHPPEQSSQQPRQFNSLVTLNSLTVKVVAQVNEGDLNTVSADEGATITFPALPGESFSGSIDRVEPQAVNIDGKVYFLVDVALDSQPPTAYTIRAQSVGEGDEGSSSAAPLSTLVVGLTANVRF